MNGFQQIRDEKTVGIVAHNFLPEFEKAIEGNAAYQQFVRSFAPAKKWYLVSDYCFSDPKKPNDAVCFSIIPHVLEVETFLSGLDRASGRDIKSVRKVSPLFIKALEQLPIFNMAFVLNGKRRLCANERLYFKTKIDAARRQLEVWDQTTPQGMPFTARFRAKLLRLEEEISSRGANLKLIRDIEIVSSMAGYFASTLAAKPGELVTWFSDRDNMLSFKVQQGESALAYDLAFTLHHVLCSRQPGGKSGHFAFGVPEPTGRMFYDPLNRIPDLICGTLADFNLHTRQASHAKFGPILRHLFIRSNRNAFYRLNLNAEGVRMSEIRFSLTPFQPQV